jgi:cytochrome P450
MLINQIGGYLGDVLNERYANPGSDMLSSIAKWRDNPRFQGTYEEIGMALLIFFGGLDTVANILSFVAWHLATHPEHRQRLVDQPDIIPRAAEEYFRRFGLSNTGRLIVQDVERKGVIMRKGEMVMVPIGLSALDDRVYSDPFEVDYDRENVFDSKGNPDHNTFGNGPHKCVGSPLARAELIVFLEEWTQRMPPVRLNPDRPPVSHMGPVNGVEQLHLIWDV